MVTFLYILLCASWLYTLYEKIAYEKIIVRYTKAVIAMAVTINDLNSIMMKAVRETLEGEETDLGELTVGMQTLERLQTIERTVEKLKNMAEVDRERFS